jgi:photosystem II stability/assembly factor-like uncharacterized protein
VSGTFARLLLGAAVLAAVLVPASRWEIARSARPARPERPGPFPSDWFLAQRAWPLGHIPYARWQQAVEQARVERAAFPAQGTASLAWEEIGPYNVGGRLTAIAAPAGGAPVYVGAAAGGVFKSDDGGQSFAPVFDAAGFYSIGAIALDPADSSVVYVGTGESNSSGDSYPGGGVFKSTDAGATWSHAGLAESRHIGRIAVDPAEPQRVFVAALGGLFTPDGARGLYRSQDGGAQWQQVLFVDDSTGVSDVVVNPAHPETVFAASWTRRRTPFYRRAWGPASGIWRSTDHGDTWTRLGGGLPDSARVGRIALDIPPSLPSRVYAQVIDSTGGGLGFYRSDDGGDTWTRRDVTGFTNNFGGFGWYFGTVRAHPANADQVWALGVGLRRSTTGGDFWSGATGTMHVDFHDLWVDPADPQHMYAGNDGGFYRSTDAGGSWVRSLDLPVTQFYAGDVDQANPDRAIGGTQDNSTPMTQAGGLSSWDVLLSGDGFHALIAPDDPDVVFGEAQYCTYGGGPFKSTNGGASFAPSGAGLVIGDRFNWSTPYAFAPGNSQLMVLGSHRVYRSTDQGGSWIPISPDLTGGPYGGSGALVYGTITTLAVAPSNHDVIYAGTDDARVWVTTNGGADWTDVSAGLPTRWVTRVAVHPQDAAVAYVALSGYKEGSADPHVFRTTDGGAGWSDVSGNLVQAPVNDLVVDALDPSRLFAATDVGVYATLDAGATWFPLGTGLPVLPIADIALHEAGHVLVAFTHGRSAWRLDVSSLRTVSVERPLQAAVALAAIPNPTRGSVALALQLPAPARVAIGIFDVQGRRVADLGVRDYPAGSHRIVWDGRGSKGAVPPGIYYARAATVASVIVKRIHRLR